MKFHDAHCHVSSKKFLKDFNLEESIPEWLKKGLEYVISVSTKLSESIKSVELSKKYQQIIPGVGIHPWSAKKPLTEEIKENFLRLISYKHQIIIGEIGLDHHFIKNEEYYASQEETFHFFLEVAEQNKIAINVHLKGAEILGADILSSYNHKPQQVLIHWYSGPRNVLNEFIERGYCLSINPSILSGSSHINVLHQANLSQILTESDGNVKYMINNEKIIGSPGIIPQVLEKIGDVKKKNIEEISDILSSNLHNYLTG